MARAVATKPSFAGGEISPRLYGRSDIARYNISAEAIENFLVRPEGGLMRRHGTRFVGETKDHARVSRIEKFIFSTVQAYIIEFGHQFIRIYKDRAPVTSASNSITAISKANPAVVTYSGADNLANGDHAIITGVVGMVQLNNREVTIAGLNAGANTVQLSGIDSSAYDTYVSGGTISKIYEIVSPYSESEVDDLVITQSTDTLYITHPSYAPRTLTRTAHTTWTLATFDLSKGPFAPRNTDLTKHILFTAVSFAPGEGCTIRSNADIFESGHVGSLFYVEERYLADNAVSPWEATKQCGTTLGTQVSHNGNVYEMSNAGAGSNTGNAAPVHTSGEAFDGVQNASNNYRGWRYLHSRWAIIEITVVTDSKNVQGTIRTRLPNGLAPTAKSVTATAAGASTGYVRLTIAGHGFGDGDYVYVASVGGTTEANGSWRIVNVTANTFELEGVTHVNAWTAGGTATRYATWMWRFGAFSAVRGYPAAVALHEQRLIFGNTLLQPFGLWASRAGDYNNYLPGTLDDDTIAYNIAGNQADPIRWLASASDLVLGTLAQEYAAYGGGLGDPITPTNTRIVPQSGEGSNAVQPIKVGSEILFCNRAGRKLFALLNQASVNGYLATDLLELAEHLTVGKTITRIAWAKNPTSTLWALRSDGSLIAMTYRRDQEIWAWTRHPITGTVESIAVIPSPDGTTDDLWVTVARTINGGTKRYIEYLAPPFEPTSATDKNGMGYVDSALQYNGAAVSTFSGLWHLEGLTIKVVAGGAVHADCLVSGGKITLDGSYTNVWAGIGYTSRVRTLRIDAAEMGAQARLARINRLTVRLLNAIGGKAGPASETTMDELVQRGLADPMDASSPMYSGDVDVHIATEHELGPRLSIIQDTPMPLDILALMPLVSAADG